MSTALAVLPGKAISVITAADPDDILGKLADEVKAHKPDISTEKGRSAIRSLAAKIASDKVRLVKIGNDQRAEWVRLNKAVIAEEKIIEERMNALRDQVRAPLTEYENAEKARIAGHEAALDMIAGFAAYKPEDTAAILQDRLEDLRAMPERDWQEFKHRAGFALEDAEGKLKYAYAVAAKREAEAAELVKLREQVAEQARQQAERDREAREKQIAADAAAKAKADAEAEAQQREANVLQAAAEQRAQEAREAAAKLKAEQDKAKAAQEAADKAQRDAEALAVKVKADKLQAKADADAREAAAVEAERLRVQQEANEAAAKTKRLEADKAHRTAINREVLADLVKAGMEPEAAKAVLNAIYKRQVRHVSISYDGTPAA